MLYVMVGFPGSGKSTLSRTLTAVRVDIDDLARMMFGEDWYTEKRYELIKEYEDLIVSDLLMQEWDVVIDRCNVSAMERRHWTQLAKRMGSEATAIYMHTLWDVCVERRPNIPELTMKDYKTRFEFPNEQEGFVEVRTVTERDMEKIDG
jgi:predicted kinase